MNTDKKVFEKLFSKDKVELSSEKFEFALIDDVTKQAKLVEDMGSKIAIDGENMLLLQGRVKQEGGFALKESNKLLQLQKQLETAYKELGLDFTKEMVYSRILDARLRIDNLQKRFGIKF
jgi:hypothetical protein